MTEREKHIEMAQRLGLVGMRPHLDGIYIDALAAFAKLVADDARATPALPEGMALVPVDALNRIMELAGVALVYQPFGTKDRQHFDALMAIIEDKP